MGRSRYTDGKIACFRCRQRTAPQLLHRVKFDKLQDDESRARRDRDTKPVWLCPTCWQRKFAIA